ncbi:MAG: HEPN domain-containing protein [Candidatus Margulisiibacteriota bacterium]
MNNEANTKDWLAKAQDDFDFASINLKDKDKFYAQICFHFQQSAEKYLKAFIVEKNLEFRKIHDLRLLLKICAAANSLLNTLMEDCDFLSPFYIDTRYPVHWPATITREEAEKAKAAVEEIKNAILKAL